MRLNLTNSVIRSGGIALVALAVSVVTTTSSFAVTDSASDANGEHLVVQAEDFTTNVINSSFVNYPVDHAKYNGGGNPVEEGWEVINVAGAAGGKALQGNPIISGGGGASHPEHAGTASYDVRFNATGAYTMYLRATIFDVLNAGPPLGPGAADGNYGHEDSFFFPGSISGSGNFGLPTSVANGLNRGIMWTSNGVDDINNVGQPADGTFDWLLHTGTPWGAGPQPLPEYTVTGAEQGTVMQWTVDTREAGIALDAIIFSTNPNLTIAQLDALAGVPEPGSIVLLGLGLSSLLAFRNRRSS